MDDVKILLQVKGHAKFEQNDCAYDIKPDCVVIYDPTSDYTLDNTTAIEQIIMQMPRSMLDTRSLTRLSNPVVLTAIGAHHSYTLASFLKTAFATAEKMEPSMRASLALSLTVFIQGVVTDAFKDDMLEIIENGSLKMLKARIIEHIEKNISCADLSVNSIAHKMGCSQRYLHKAFEDSGSTLHRYIQEKKIEHSYQLLTSPQLAQSSISEIAFASGFNSSAHFCRAFKKRFNQTPNQLRKQHLENSRSQ